MTSGLEEHLAHLGSEECGVVAVDVELFERLLACGGREELRVGFDDGEEVRVFDPEFLLDDRGLVGGEDAVGEFLIEQPVTDPSGDLSCAVDEVLALLVGEQAVLDAELVALDTQKRDVLRNELFRTVGVLARGVVPEEDPLRFEALTQVAGDLVAHSRFSVFCSSSRRIRASSSSAAIAC